MRILVDAMGGDLAPVCPVWLQSRFVMVASGIGPTEVVKYTSIMRP